MKLLKAAVPLVSALAAFACQSGGDIQPIVIDLSARSATPTAAPTAAAPVAPPPSPTPTAAPAPPPKSPTPAPAPARPAAASPAPVPVSSPEAVARMRIDAHNRKSLDSLASIYASDARIFEPPDRLRDSGAEQIRQSLARRFSSPDWARIEVTSRIVEGNYVVETETESRADGLSRSAIVISEVRDGKILNIWILR